MRTGVALAGIAAAAVALSGCGGSASARAPIVFGIKGGNIRPYSVTIESNGTVHVRGTTVVHRDQISTAIARGLARDIKAGNLASSNCTGALPDEASRYIRVGGRTVTVHGTCEVPFQNIWMELVSAVGAG